MNKSLLNSIFYQSFFKRQFGGQDENEEYENELKDELITLRDNINIHSPENAVEIDLTRISFDRILKILSENNIGTEDNRMLIRIGEDTYLTLNNTSVMDLTTIYNEEEQFGSDEDTIYNIIDDTIYIERRTPPKPKEEKKEEKQEGGYIFKQGKRGGYWKYNHLLDYDLSRYGVFKQGEEDYENNCLYEALKYGRLSDKKLFELKFLLQRRDIPTNKLKKICEKLNIKIVLSKLRNTKKDNKTNKNGKIRKVIYGTNDKEVYNIGLIDNHFFINEETELTNYSLKNYEDVKDEYMWNTITEKRSNGNYRRKIGRNINSFNVLRLLLLHKEKLLKPISYETTIGTIHYDKAVNYDKLDYSDNSVRLINREKKKKKDDIKYKKVFFDFETYTRTTDKKHIPYLCSMKVDGEKRTKTFIGEDCGKQMLKRLVKYDNVVLIAHNCYYDFNFVVEHLYKVRNPIFKGNGLISCEATFYYNHKRINLKFKDSYKLITMPLRKFGKCFKLDQKKEIMPYNAYNIRNPIKNSYMKKDEFLSFVNEEDREECFENCIKWKCYDKRDNDINILIYSKKYCEMDVIVLEQGYNQFKEWMLELTKLDIDNQFTNAGLSYNYLKKQGCFDGCYELSGIPRDFIQKCVVGGRCMTNNNKKYRVKQGKIADYDAVSLYPSAMYRMEGFLKGKPIVLNENQLNYDFLKSVDGYFIKIVIDEVNIERQFSLMSLKNEDGIRIFSNDMVGKELYVDKTTLEDYIEYHDIKFRVLQGYYFNEGRNPKIRDTILHLFKGRLQKKKEGNGIQVVYKMILNSAYGKTILKPIEEEVKIVNDNDFTDYLGSKYNEMKVATRIGDKFYIKEYKPINIHYNSCHLGVEVLSMSKRIMNEVMCLAEDNNIFIYYQDTDSCHLNYEDVAKLEKLFKDKYDRELSGKDMGQLHIDFEMDDVPEENEDTIYSRNAYFLGKKMYIDELVGKDKDGKEVVDYHIRMKGVPSSCILFECKRNNISPLDIYEKLYNGEEIAFDLTQDGKKACFDFRKSKEGMSVYTKSEFERKIKCVYEEGDIPTKKNDEWCVIN